ncbi:cytochrome c551 [Lysinibacillus piscis]|uniref:Cytochrome c domain-containing protein n=1 Tax=Lysinibacillus piscis TaxID=2518931 RepID=A0ABQ5NNG7_9BACI|nr:cytochrome c [Lysinibacillus sp. KH24]GLC89849.1 hypothetical protein LYSBPC_29760 [Lysinibacillus sp. KH24]
MKKAMLTLVAGSAIFLAACGGGDKESTGGETAPLDGETIAKKSCIMCHGGELTGQGNTPAINDIGARLSETEILDIIKNGKNTMPANVVKGAEAEAVAKWLATQK